MLWTHPVKKKGVPY